MDRVSTLSLSPSTISSTISLSYGTVLLSFGNTFQGVLFRMSG